MVRSIISSLLTLTTSTPLFLCSRTFFIFYPRDFSFSSNRLQIVADSIMPRGRGRGIKHKEEKWQVKSSPTVSSSLIEGASIDRVEGISNSLRGVSLAEQSGQALTPVSHIQFGGAVLQNHTAAPGQKAIWKPKSFGTLSGGTTAPLEDVVTEQKGIEPGTHDKGSSRASVDELLRGKLLENFTVDDNTYSHAQIRATFYPKFENEKSDQEIRTRMIEMVDRGLATLEVTLKHSGSLFMYAGHNGGAYAKNSFGNIYTAVGVFVLGRTLREAWGVQSSRKQAEFNEYLERNNMCISMELVTAVLGDHGQRPREDYVVVTAITELGVGKPKFYSTPEIIAFCRKWRLPTNHVWLFSTRKSVTSFFAAFDALCEEGTATSVCKAFDALCEEGMTMSSCKALDSEVANISVPASKDHVMVQGEILEGLVARMVSPESFKQMKEVLRDYPPAPMEIAELDLGPSLRQICAANRSDEKQQIKALLEEVGTSFCPDYVDWLGKEGGDAHSRTADRSLVTKFLQAHPADYSTRKLQEMIRLMKDKRFQVAFKCYYNLHKAGSMSKDNVHCKMVIHVHSDSVFRRYQKEMRHDPGLWPLYRGFFIDLNFFRGNKERASEMGSSNMLNTVNGNSGATRTDSLADQDANLMVKLKFLTYKLRTFLIRNGLPILFKDGPAAYRTYYLRQMKIWGTSAAKQKELSKMLDEWAVYITRKCGPRQLKSDIYLSEAEPFLEQYARKIAANQALIGAAGNLVRCEDFLAIVGGMDEEGDLQKEQDMEPPALSPNSKEVARKEGILVFFPGIPGCAKSALCKELLIAGAFGDNRPVQSLMGDLIKGRYWQQVADVCKKKPNTIILADKNAPNEEVWKQIEQMCVANRACAVPVVPDSAGTDSNPFSLDALAVFMYRVLQRVNHPGNLDKSSPNAGFVLLMFYHLYEGKSRSEFEAELVERFGSIVKMPFLKPERACLPDSIKCKLEEGINLYRLHTKRHRRLESTKGSYAKEWEKWEKELRETLLSNAEYLNKVQVPFESVVKTVSEQLKAIAKGDYTPPSSEKKRLGAIVFACVTLPVSEIHGFINDFTKTHPEVEAFLKNKNLTDNLKKAHVTLAHKNSHGVVAVANYAQFLSRKVPVEMIAFLFSDTLAALEVRIGSVDGEKIIPKNEWPHVTLWTAQGVPPKEANTLPLLVAQGKAARVEIEPPICITGKVMFS